MSDQENVAVGSAFKAHLEEKLKKSRVADEAFEEPFVSEGEVSLPVDTQDVGRLAFAELVALVSDAVNDFDGISSVKSRDSGSFQSRQITIDFKIEYDKVVCPVCDGDCEVVEEYGDGETEYIQCPECNGMGFVEGDDQ
jgi:hypothetical protein